MGKGDKRSRKGKIFAGSFGKTRPKRKKANTAPAGEPAKAEKPAPRARKKADAAG
jgi:30S ribosomal protein S31